MINMDVCLLDDLLEASERIYHKNAALIQSIFAKQYFTTLAKIRQKNPHIRSLGWVRRLLKEKQDEFMREQQDAWAERDRKIRNFVCAAAAA